MAKRLKTTTYLDRKVKNIKERIKQNQPPEPSEGQKVLQRATLMGLASFFWYFMLQQQPAFGLALLVIATYMPLPSTLVRPEPPTYSEEDRKYLNGHYGETLVNQKLQTLSDDYYLIPDLNLGEGYQIDHVLVGPFGVLVIETKNISGTFQASPNPDYWYKRWHNKWVPVKNPQKQAAKNTNRLHELISHLIDNQQPPIFTTVVFARGPMSAKYLGPKNKNCSIMYLHQLIPSIQNLPAKLTPDQVENLAQTILSLDTEPEQPAAGSPQPPADSAPKQRSS